MKLWSCECSHQTRANAGRLGALVERTRAKHCKARRHYWPNNVYLSSPTLCRVLREFQPLAAKPSDACDNLDAPPSTTRSRPDGYKPRLAVENALKLLRLRSLFVTCDHRTAIEQSRVEPEGTRQEDAENKILYGISVYTYIISTDG